jgi:hypothetical protein
VDGALFSNVPLFSVDMGVDDETIADVDREDPTWALCRIATPAAATFPWPNT